MAELPKIPRLRFRNPLGIFGWVFVGGGGPLAAGYGFAKGTSQAWFFALVLGIFVLGLGVVFCILLYLRPWHLYAPPEFPEGMAGWRIYGGKPPEDPQATFDAKLTEQIDAVRTEMSQKLDGALRSGRSVTKKEVQQLIDVAVNRSKEAASEAQESVAMERIINVLRWRFFESESSRYRAAPLKHTVAARHRVTELAVDEALKTLEANGEIRIDGDLNAEDCLIIPRSPRQIS